MYRFVNICDLLNDTTFVYHEGLRNTSKILSRVALCRGRDYNHLLLRDSVNYMVLAVDFRSTANLLTVVTFLFSFTVEPAVDCYN